MADGPQSPDPVVDPPIRVVVIEPRPILGIAVREILDQNADFDVVAHVPSAAAATPFLEDAPDVVVVDLDLPDPSGDATRRLRQAAPTSAFVVIGGQDEDASLVGAIGIGAVAHVGETAAPHELVETIRRVVDGADPIKEDLAARPDLVDRIVDGVRESLLAEAGPRLTARELEILRHAAGSSNRQIAAQFGLSEQTVKNHLTSIFHKLGVPNRTRAVMYATRQGWLDVAEVSISERPEPAPSD